MADKPKRITKKLVKKLIETVSCGLSAGLGSAQPGKMCVEAAVCYAYGLPHSDKPPCVGAQVREFKIGINDARWSSNKARAEGMLELSIAQLNSNTLDQGEFTRRLGIKVMNTMLAEAVRNEALAKRLREVVDEKEAISLFNSTVLGMNRISFLTGLWALRRGNTIASLCRVLSDLLKHKSSDPDYAFKWAAQLCLEVLKEMKSPGCDYLYMIEDKKQHATADVKA